MAIGYPIAFFCWCFSIVIYGVMIIFKESNTRFENTGPHRIFWRCGPVRSGIAVSVGGCPGCIAL
jgi:hypothetical protein